MEYYSKPWAPVLADTYRMLVLAGYLSPNCAVDLTAFLLFCGFFFFFHVKVRVKHKCCMWSDSFFPVLILTLNVFLKNKNEEACANHSKALDTPECFSKGIYFVSFNTIIPGFKVEYVHKWCAKSRPCSRCFLNRFAVRVISLLCVSGVLWRFSFWTVKYPVKKGFPSMG